MIRPFEEIQVDLYRGTVDFRKQTRGLLKCGKLV
jgi:hypothetical protein